MAEYQCTNCGNGRMEAESNLTYPTGVCDVCREDPDSRGVQTFEAVPVDDEESDEERPGAQKHT